MNEQNLISNIENIDSKIYKLKSTIRDELFELEEEKQRLTDILNEMVTKKAITKLDNKPYKCGTTYIETPMYKVKVVIGKLVKYDQKEMGKVAKLIEKANRKPEDFMSVKYSVKEKDYEGFNDEIKAQFREARSVEQKKPVITYELKD